MWRERNRKMGVVGVGLFMMMGIWSHLEIAHALLVFTEETILVPSDSNADDDFGGAVAIDGDTAIVGAPEQEVGGETNQGSAYIFVRDNGGTWTEQAKLLGSDSDALDHFGTSVDIEGDTAVVGGGIGNVAYVFVRTGTQWNEQAKLTAPGVGSVDQFGSGVAISGNTIIVGAYRDNAAGGTNGPGAAFVFVRNGTTWGLQDTLVADDGENGDEFGRSVALEGDLAIVGASGDDQVGKQNAGSAYVFLRTGTAWNQETKLEAADITAFDQMGWAVALSGNTALIGARSGNGAIDQAGVAYVFTRNGTTWTPQGTLFPENENPLHVGGSRFGHAVALLDNVALIGSPRTDLAGFPDNGAAYLFERKGTVWSQAGKLIPSVSATSREFGGGVALTQNRAFVGASEQFSSVFPGLNAAYPFSLTRILPLSTDLDGDGKSDIVWRNTSNGATALWLLNGIALASAGFPGGVPLEWQIAGVGDVNADGKADVIWRNGTSGTVAVWLMNGLTITSVGFPGSTSTDWEIEQIGDVDGNGTADLVWRNTGSGVVAVWFMNGATIASTGFLGGVPAVWQIAGVGDVNGDDKADVIWRNSTSGTVAVWLMNGLTITSVGFPGSAPTDWEIEQIGDVDGNGTADLVWRNTGSGGVAVWLLDGTTIASSGILAGKSLVWEIARAGDVNGDEKADFIWYHTTTGEVEVWLMNGFTITSMGSPGTTSADWEIQ
jgi:hypothetical protein